MTADRGGRPFLTWLGEWYAGLPEVAWGHVIDRSGGAQRVALLVVDLLVGFCSEGPLASPRVAALGPRVAQLLESARAAGIATVLLAADAHPEDSPEFAAFPPHCIRGTRQAETIPELTELPLWPHTVRFPKGSLNVGLEPAFAAWEAEHPEIRGWIVVGDCTDLCIYQTAMHLRLQANSLGLERHIWVPAEFVDTYDLPVSAAAEVAALPHDGDLLHSLFLYHLALNGVSVVRSLAR